MTAECQHDRLEVKVIPGAARSEITGVTAGVLHLKIAAPPVRGKANRELIDLLSRALGVSRSAVSIVRGQTSRHKAIEVEGMDREEIIRRLSAEK
jgi:uncharacterized protein (TIGR00251 family)